MKWDLLRHPQARHSQERGALTGHGHGVPLQDIGGICVEYAAEDIHLAFVDIPALVRHCRSGREESPSWKRPGLNPIEKHLDLPFLNDREIEQVNSFKSLKRQVEWIGGRYAVKRLVGEIAGNGVGMGEIEVLQAPEGALYLPAWPDFSLSLSHSGNLAAAGVGASPDKIIGLDIEHLVPMDVRAVLKVGFTEREILEMDETPPRELLCRWTVKEAYLKYLRKGFHESLKRVEYRGGCLYYDRALQAGLRIESRGIGVDYVFSMVWGDGRRDDDG